MTSEEFVRKSYPRARVERFTTNRGDVYYLCWANHRGSRMGGQRLSEGKSASNAWVNAKKYLTEG